MSQYKFYQGFIQDKGSKNALTKLFDALASDDKDSLDFYEEWAIKDGQYGASEGFDDVIFRLDESKFRLVPQPIELVNSITGDETDLIYRIRPYEVYQKSKNYDHKPFPSKYVFDSYTRNAGYVNQQDVRGIVTNYSNIVDFNFASIKQNEYIWVGNEDRNWNVYQHIDTGFVVEKIHKGTDTVKITLTKNANNFYKKEIIGIHDVYHIDSSKEDFEGFFEITDVTNNEVTVKVNTPLVEDIENVVGNITKFKKVRATNIAEANLIAQTGINQNDLLWVDTITTENEWSVLKNTNHFSEQSRIQNNESGSAHEYGKNLAVDDRNTTLLVGAPNYQDGKVYVYHRPTNGLTFTLTQILEPTKYGDDNEKFGTGVAITPDAKFIAIGSPSASNVKTKYAGAFVASQDYPKNSIVQKDEGLWKALVDIEGEESNIQFNSFYSVTQAIFALGLENDPNNNITVLLTGNYSIDPTSNNYASTSSVNHMLVRAPKNLYDGSGIHDTFKLTWNSITYANQDTTALTSKAPFNGDHSVITDAFLSQEHTIQKKIDAVLFIDSATNLVELGDQVQTAVASGYVDYVYEESGDLIVYLRDVNGSFNSEDSLFRDDGDFIGQYVKQAPVDSIDTSDVWGGYWYIDTPAYQPTASTTNIDKAAGLIYYDVITDSTDTGRYYYNSLDYATNAISSQNVYNAYMRTLTYRGLPGAGGSNSIFPSDLYVMRAPKDLTDLVSPGDPVTVYVNQLPQYNTGDLKDLTTIGLSTAITNTTRNIYDIWDGYINFDFTKFDVNGNPFEPRVGDTIEDLSTGATATVVFYQRDSLNVTIFVKNVIGTFSVGDDYGQNAEIKFIGTPSDPDVTYQVDRTMGEIQFVSLGFASAGIGKMLVFQAPSDITLQTEDTLNDIEYWMYSTGVVSGIPRSNPSN